MISVLDGMESFREWTERATIHRVCFDKELMRCGGADSHDSIHSNPICNDAEKWKSCTVPGRDASRLTVVPLETTGLPGRTEGVKSVAHEERGWVGWGVYS